jgi:glycosyltransferase involved in cell wall biosynthesis
LISVHTTAFAVESQPVSSQKIAPELSIVMACLNEAETLGTCIRKAQNALAELTIAGELVIADSGSSDGSQEIARRFGTQVVNKAKVLTQAA